LARELRIEQKRRTFVRRQFNMMGYQTIPQNKLFYIGIDLDSKVRKNHPLRKINETVDFDFIYSEVKECYGSNGNVSVPPAVTQK